MSYRNHWTSICQRRGGSKSAKMHSFGDATRRRHGQQSFDRSEWFKRAMLGHQVSEMTIFPRTCPVFCSAYASRTDSIVKG